MHVANGGMKVKYNLVWFRQNIISVCFLGSTTSSTQKLTWRQEMMLPFNGANYFITINLSCLEASF